MTTVTATTTTTTSTGTTSSNSPTTTRSEKAAGRVLLPNHLIPIRYDLEIKPDLDTFLFQGTVSIELKIDTEQLLSKPELCNKITLHAKELCFASAEYTVLVDDPSAASTAAVVADEIHVSIKETTVTFVFGQSFPTGSSSTTTDGTTSSSSNTTRIVLKIQYSGFINNQMCGFYRSMYNDINGTKQYMASTQFESLDARRAIPCIDEPAVKAIFGVTFIVPTKFHVISNMPEKNISTMNASTKKVSFLDTPRMSTYLLAYCIGEYDSVQGMTNNGVLVRVLTPPNKSYQGLYSLDVAIRCLDLYDTFFGIHFPLPKLDMIAIPEFAMGAMENWGLVTYREVELLIDPATASSKQKQRVAVVVAHELAHQWFGNLVTMQWWDDLWLNEGFASWAENYAVDALFPEYTMWDQFTIDHLSAALRLDALQSSHPIQVPIYHAEEVEQVFDSISYCKGGSVVRMIKAVLGMKYFQQGLSNYMKKYAYSNTETLDLWGAWEEVSQMPVVDMMASWTEQMGFPLLKVVKEDWQDDKVVFELEQSWFLSDGSELDDVGKAKKWTIPILTSTDQGSQSDMTLMREKTATVTIPLSGSTGWVKLNANHEVPMRVFATEEMTKRIAAGIQSKQLHRIDRAGLLNDAYALVKAGHQSPASLIQLVGNYKDEDEYVAWQALSGVLFGLDKIVSDDIEISTNLRNFVKPLVLSLLKKIGWQPQSSDGHMTTLLRSTMITLISKFAYDDVDVVTEAKKRFAAFQENADDVDSLPSDIRPQVFKIILLNGGETEYKAIKSYFNTASSSAEQKHVLNSLGSIPDAKLKLETMEWSTSGEIKLQDFFYVMGSVGSSGNGGSDISWNYFQTNFTKIQNFIGSGSSASLMDAVIVMCAGNFSSTHRANEIQLFFETNPLPRNTRKISQLIEEMKTNGTFYERIQASELSNTSFWESSVQ